MGVKPQLKSIKFLSFTFLLKQFFIKSLFRCTAKKCVVLLLFIASQIHSQVFYSVKPDYFKIKTDKNNLLNKFSTSYPDTSIADFHNTFTRNFMGNIGMPSPNYTFKYNTPDIGFRFYQPSLANDMISEDQVQYFRTKGPYADLAGFAGSKVFQALKLLFTHTYRDKINITMRLNRYSSTGYYNKQQTFVNNFYVTSNYTRSNQRAGYYFYFLNNSNRYQENGGIKGDTLGEASILKLKTLIPVNISAASRDNKEYKLMFNPWLKLNKAADSLNELNSFLQLRSKFVFNTYKYKDANVRTDKIYPIFLDTLKTYDSSRVMQFVNEVNYSLLKPDQNFGASFGYKNEINKVWQKKDSLFLNHIICADLIIKKELTKKDSANHSTSLFENRSNAQFIISGANGGNYKFENISEIIFKGKYVTKIFLNVMAENRNADYIYNNWMSNNFNWANNGYKAAQTQQAKLGITHKNKMGVSLLLQSINNYLFFDHAGLPQQINGSIQNLAVNAYYTTVFFKHLGISLSNIFQSTTSESYVRVPQNISTVKLFYTGNLFKNNLQLNIGVQGQSYQSFYAYAYRPALQQFYLQNKRTTGDYPYVDVYLNARIRPVTIFVKVENVLQGYAGTNFSLVQGYYQTDRAFRLGLSWTFFD